MSRLNRVVTKQLHAFITAGSLQERVAKSLVNHLFPKRGHSSYHDTTKQRNALQRDIHSCACALVCQTTLLLILSIFRRVSMCRSCDVRWCCQRAAITLSSLKTSLGSWRDAISEQDVLDREKDHDISWKGCKSRRRALDPRLSPIMHQTHKALPRRGRSCHGTCSHFQCSRRR